MKFSPKMKTDKTRKSRVYEQGNPYKAQSMLDRDDETMMRNRVGDYAENE